MKAKKIVPENSEQPETLLAPSNKEKIDELSPWQKEIVALAEARLSILGEEDVINEMHRRAIGLCRVIEDFSIVGDDNDLSMEALGQLMRVLTEHIQVAKWLTSGRPLDPRWY
jgi:hypothetical protein